MKESALRCVACVWAVYVKSGISDRSKDDGPVVRKVCVRGKIERDKTGMCQTRPKSLNVQLDYATNDKRGYWSADGSFKMCQVVDSCWR